MQPETRALAVAALPCPWCGKVPDTSNANSFWREAGGKWGAVQCCCIGPDIRAGYRPLEEWKDEAIEAWNERAAPQAGPAVMSVEVRREADDKYIVLMSPKRIAALEYVLRFAEIGVGHDQYDSDLQVIKELLAELGVQPRDAADVQAGKVGE